VPFLLQTIQFLVKLPYTPATYYSDTNVWGQVFFWVFAFFPWNPLTKGILDLNEATLASTDPGICWSQQYSYCSHQPDFKLHSPLLIPPLAVSVQPLFNRQFNRTVYSHHHNTHYTQLHPFIHTCPPPPNTPIFQVFVGVSSTVTAATSLTPSCRSPTTHALSSGATTVYTLSGR
jgi:hypothetical protein